MAICKWCGENNADGVNVCSFCGQDMSIFEDSGLMKTVPAGDNPVSEASRPRVTVPTGGATAAGAASMNSGSLSSGAVRTAARAQQAQQAQKRSEYVTRNQLKQVAYRLDQKSKTLTVLTTIVAVAAVAGIVLGVRSLLTSNAPAEDTTADATIAQLQSQVSTLELQLETVTAQLDELREEDSSSTSNMGSTTAPSTSTTTTTGDGDTQSGDTSSGVNITTDDEEDPPIIDVPSTETTGDTEPSESDAELEVVFQSIEGDGTSVYAVVNQTFEGTTTYQWQRKANSSTADTWTDVSTSAAKTDTLTISVDDYLRNNSYRCRVTNVDTRGVTTVYYTEAVDYNAYQIWSLIG